MSSYPLTSKRPGLLTALVVGVLIALPLMVAFFAANALFRLPLLPINVMDWLPNNLPADLLNAGKNAMVSVLMVISPGDLDGVAKSAEVVIGTATLFGITVLGVVVLFLIARTRTAKNAGVVTGVAVGAVLGILLTLLYFSLPLVQNERSAYLLLDTLFIVGLYILAGYSAGRIFDTLRQTPAEADTTASAEQLNRRQFLVRVGSTTATLTVAGAVVSLLANGGSGDSEGVGTPLNTTPSPTTSNPVPPTSPSGDFVAAPGTRPEMTPLEEHYRIDIVSRPPEIDASTWTLPLVGMVNSPQNFTLTQLREMPSFDRIVTMSCISNPVGGDLISTTRWTGIKMQDLVTLAQPKPEAAYLRITCADGFDEYVSLAMIRNDERIMLAYEWDGRPLLQKHGFPVRIHIPNHYGMKQPKWITNIEFVADWQEGYWVRRGWSPTATVQMTSVIDTVAAASAWEAEGATYVPIGGIAFSGDKGISLVEVSVDGGTWTPATLKETMSDNTWYLWRYDWPYAAGEHTFEVRCVDGRGGAQDIDIRGVAPDGATGIYRVRRTV